MRCVVKLETSRALILLVAVLAAAPRATSQDAQRPSPEPPPAPSPGDPGLDTALAKNAARLDAASRQALFHLGAGADPARISVSFSACLEVGLGGDGSANEPFKHDSMQRKTDSHWLQNSTLGADRDAKARSLDDLIKISGQVRADARLWAFDIPLLGIGAEVRPIAKKKIVPILNVLGFALEIADAPETRARSNAVAEGQQPSTRDRSNAVVGDNPCAPAGRTFGPLNVLPGDFQQTFFAGPVPILVRANAGVGFDLGITPIVETLGANIEAGAYLHGWASGGIGAGFGPVSASAGVMATLRVLDTKVGLRLGARTPLDAFILDLKNLEKSDQEIADILNQTCAGDLHAMSQDSYSDRTSAPPNGWSLNLEDSPLLPRFLAPAGAWTEEMVRAYKGQGSFGGITLTVTPLEVALALYAQAKLQIGWLSFARSYSLTIARWRAPSLQHVIPLGDAGL